MRTTMLSCLAMSFVMLWSSGWVASRLAVGNHDVGPLLFERYVIVVLVLTLIVTLRGRWQRMSLLDCLQQMLVGTFTHALYLMAALSAFERGVSTSLVTFIIMLHPMLTAALTRRVSHERIVGRQWQGLLLGLLAIALTTGQSLHSGVSGAALLLPFLSVLSITVGSLLNRRLEMRQMARHGKARPVSLLLLLQSVGAIIALYAMTGSAPLKQLGDHSTGDWLVLVWLALIVSIGAYGIMQHLLQQMSATAVASLSYLVPPATMMQAMLIFDERLTMLQVLALIIATAGVFLVLTPTPRSGSFEPTGRASILRRNP